MNQSNQYKSKYIHSRQTGPERRSERDALTLLRNGRAAPSKRGQEGRFALSMSVKIGAISLVFAGIVLSVWVLKPSRPALEDEALPMIANDFGASSFKIAPRKEDAIRIPHSDKAFYSELEPLSSLNPKEKFRAIPEIPSQQVSQKALFLDAEKKSKAIPVSKKTTEPSKSGASSVMAEDQRTLSEESKDIKESSIKIVEMANDKSETYKAPPLTTLDKPRKTLEMAINETQQAIHRRAKGLLREKSLSKKHLDKTLGGKTQDSFLPQKTPQKALASAPVVVPPQTLSLPSSNAQLESVPHAENTYWVQIASLPTQASAHKEWKRLQRKAPKALKGQSYETVRVDLGKPKGIRYRVHLGPFTRPQAVQSCKALKGRKISCLVVKKK